MAGERFPQHTNSLASRVHNEAFSEPDKGQSEGCWLVLARRISKIPVLALPSVGVTRRGEQRAGAVYASSRNFALMGYIKMMKN